MKLNLPNSVYSPQALTRLIMEIEDYGQWLNHNKVKKKAGAKLSSKPEISPAAEELIAHWQGKKKEITTKKLDELLIALDDHQLDAPLMTITLAAPPTNGIKKTLVEWSRKNVSSDILIRFEFNRTILGGMVVRLGSHIYDWSFRKQILNNRDNFSKVLRNV